MLAKPIDGELCGVGPRGSRVLASSRPSPTPAMRPSCSICSICASRRRGSGRRSRHQVQRASAGVIGAGPDSLTVELAEPVHQGRIMGVFIGLDVSLNKAAVCVVDRDGVVLWQGKVPSEPGPLITRLAEWSGKIDLAGIEACPLSEWLHRGLCEAGILVVWIETRHAQRFLSPRPVKTDRNDARGLAEMMRLGHYRPAHVESPAAQSMRNNACRPDAARLGAVANRKHHPRPIEALRFQDRRNPSEPLCGSGRRVARDGRYV